MADVYVLGRMVTNLIPTPGAGGEGVLPEMHNFMVLSTLATLPGMEAGWEFLGKAVFHRKTLIYQESIFNTGILFHAISSSG